MTVLSPNKQQGATTLIITIIALCTITLIILFAAGYTLMQQKITSNQYRTNEAYGAAEAGLEFAIPYLQLNRTAIIANTSAGFLLPYNNSDTQDVVLPNNSRYSIVYTNPTANDYDVILITVTGTSADNTSTRVVSQVMQYGSQLVNIPNSSVISQGFVRVTGSSNIINTEGPLTIQSGSSVTFGGSAQTTLSTGKSSSRTSVKSDVKQHNYILSGTSPSDFFASYFGMSGSAVKANTTDYYSNDSDANYSSVLNGKTDTVIWIDQTAGTASLNGNTTIGSPTLPVILIVNGNLWLSGTLTIYGMVYEMGGSTETDILGNVEIYGSLVTSGDLDITGSTIITYNNSVLTNIQNNMGYFAKIAGTWKDF